MTRVWIGSDTGVAHGVPNVVSVETSCDSLAVAELSYRLVSGKLKDCSSTKQVDSSCNRVKRYAWLTAIFADAEVFFGFVKTET
jgi:hypothetical protein